ncbi:MAG: 4Fe-4S binding protein, partial [Spirochaetales bacterium]|nr:4Fe-4S binding protein [Spirochaetales bacterium]
PWIIGGYIVRKFLARPLREHYKHFYIDETRCTRCMRCLKNCPTQSIVFANGFFFFKNSCTTCFRCRNSCLAGAIREKNK